MDTDYVNEGHLEPEGCVGSNVCRVDCSCWKSPRGASSSHESSLHVVVLRSFLFVVWKGHRVGIVLFSPAQLRRGKKAGKNGSGDFVYLAWLFRALSYGVLDRILWIRDCRCNIIPRVPGIDHRRSYDLDGGRWKKKKVKIFFRIWRIFQPTKLSAPGTQTLITLSAKTPCIY